MYVTTAHLSAQFPVTTHYLKLVCTYVHGSVKPFITVTANYLMLVCECHNRTILHHSNDKTPNSKHWFVTSYGMS